jgi:hypothetical protein
MKHKAPILLLLLASMDSLYGQEKGRTTDPNDFRTYLVESQIVEYRPKMSRDPFHAATKEDKNLEQSDMLVDEITIIGRVVASKKAYLVVLDSQQNVKQLPVGYRFQDGEIAAITEAGAVFTTWDSAMGPRSPVKRTVTKPFKREEVRW